MEKQKKRRQRKGLSIRNQMAVFFLLSMLFMMGIWWIINSTCLDTYYRWQKENAIIMAYETCNREIGELDSSHTVSESDELALIIQGLCARYNLSMIILDTDSNTIVCSNSDSKFLGRLLQDYFFGNPKTPDTVERRVLKTFPHFTLQIEEDARMKSQYLEAWGILDNGSPFLIRSAMESIHESATISTTFFLYSGLLVMFLGAAALRFASKKLSRPIGNLSDISSRMCHLDFEAKFDGGGAREIVHLGNNINALSEALEQTISELKTANNELKKDIAQKEKVEEMRKEFLSNVSHELKTPIALIQGYAEGLREGIDEDPESRAFYCDVIVDEAVRMNNMVKKLLSLNQLEFGNDVVQMERFDLAELVRSCVQSTSILIKQKGADVRIYGGAPVFVWGDEYKIEEVFINFLSNALNHLDGERIINITMEQEEERVRLLVFNTGEQIPEESIPQLWDKFYKVDKARTREYGGSGIGLSIVKAIMESLHQEYGVENCENGVAFWITLDRAQVEDEI